MTSIPRTSGIYQIMCSASKKIYIGSSVNLHRRWLAHRADLLVGIHDNRHLQRAWDKYGEDAFTFEVIELVLSPFLLEREQYWIDKKRSADFKRGYNIRPSVFSSEGVPVSEETRRKISAALKGHPGFARTREARIAKLREVRHRQFGPRSPEIRAKISATHKARGTTFTAEARAANVNACAKTYIVTLPDGQEVTIKNLRAFCRDHGLTAACMVDVVAGRSHRHRGYKVRRVEVQP